jgi:hypothetical protein
MSAIWTKIKDGTSSAARWETGYPEHETWTFRVKLNGGDYAGFFTSWFEAMAKAVKANDPLLQPTADSSQPTRQESATESMAERSTETSK